MGLTPLRRPWRARVVDVTGEQEAWVPEVGTIGLDIAKVLEFFAGKRLCLWRWGGLQQTPITRPESVLDWAIRPLVRSDRRTTALMAKRSVRRLSGRTYGFVAVKSVTAQANAVVFGGGPRDLLVRQRTPAIDAVREHLGEYGADGQ